MKLSNNYMEELLNENKKIICIGGGRGLNTFLNAFDKLEISKRIEVVVDNNSQKWGTSINVNKNVIKVISVEELVKKYDLTNYIVIVTTLYLEEIMNQLSSYSAFNDIDIYHYNLLIVSNDRSYYNEYLPNILRLSEKQLIPKIIHYCWFGKGKKSALNEKCIKSWKKYCPEYEIIEWNETNYDIEKSMFMKEAYKHKQWAFVADPARVDIMYRHGGVYLDTDVELLQNLDELLYQESFVGIDSSRKISLGLGFGSIPGKKEFLDMYSFCNAIDFSEDKIKSKEIVSPELMDNYFLKLGYEANGRLQYLNNITIYPERVLSGYDPMVGTYRKSNETFAAHLYEGTWLENSEKELVHKLLNIYQKTGVLDVIKI